MLLLLLLFLLLLFKKKVKQGMKQLSDSILKNSSAGRLTWNGLAAAATKAQ